MNTSQVVLVLQQIFEKYDLKVAVLFGSYAQGIQKTTSDIDISK